MLGIPAISWSYWEAGRQRPGVAYWEIIRQAAEARGISMPPPWEWREVVPEE